MGIVLINSDGLSSLVFKDSITSLERPHVQVVNWGSANIDLDTGLKNEFSSFLAPENSAIAVSCILSS